MKKNKIKVGIIGASGYTGSELIRLLLLHPNIELKFALSKTNKNKKISDILIDLTGETEMIFSDKIEKDIDILFLCGGHNKSIEFLNNNKLDDTIKIIDLSQDFRNDNSHKKSKRNFIYGLPEINLDEIKKSSNVANPGCFATAILLGLSPSISNGLVNGEININATTGSTGAGIIPSEKTHFSWRNSNVSWYKPFKHQHLKEIKKTLLNISSYKSSINLLTYRGTFTRGIYCSIYFKSDKSIDEIINLYKNYFLNAPFVNVCSNEISLKDVINTNKCLIHLTKIDDKILITTAIDNLIKGASGQAIQNLNLMFGIDQTTGLKLKGSTY